MCRVAVERSSEKDLRKLSAICILRRRTKSPSRPKSELMRYLIIRQRGFFGYKKKG
jgi:hypothetical protein